VRLRAAGRGEQLTSAEPASFFILLVAAGNEPDRLLSSFISGIKRLPCDFSG
jgi:hypothetical protein